MVPRTLITAMALTAIVAAPARSFAEDQHRRRQPDNAGQSRQGDQASQQAPAARERAVPRTVEPRRDEQQARREQDVQRQEQVRRDAQTSRDQQVRRDAQVNRDQQVRRDAQVNRDQQVRRDAQVNRDQQVRREQAIPRQYDSRQYDARRNDNGRYDTGRYDYRRYDGRRYNSRGYAYTPRVFRPSIVRVIPYRPYVYRPSFGIGIYYGDGGSYPYGYTPRGYYDPIPGRYYGGVRITGAPRDAHVFADGYYVGIVNDFDGIFQHINLEAGPHHIEVDDGYESIAFDVYVRPGETTTFRADGGFSRY
jgi:hypothetical protein